MDHALVANWPSALPGAAGSARAASTLLFREHPIDAVQLTAVYRARVADRQVARRTAGEPVGRVPADCAGLRFGLGQ